MTRSSSYTRSRSARGVGSPAAPVSRCSAASAGLLNVDSMRHCLRGGDLPRPASGPESSRVALNELITRPGKWDEESVSPPPVKRPSESTRVSPGYTDQRKRLLPAFEAGLIAILPILNPRSSHPPIRPRRPKDRPQSLRPVGSEALSLVGVVVLLSLLYGRLAFSGSAHGLISETPTP